MSLPPKKQKVRSGIEHGPQRIWHSHRRFVRSHQCCVPGCLNGPIEFAHVRSAANSGMGLKPGDENGISLCQFHHAEQHQIGQHSFEHTYHVNLAKLASEFVARSPDKAMKQALRENPPTN